MEQKHFESLYPVDARDKEIEELVTYIREGSSSQLVGLVGSGRSSVLGMLAFNKAIRLKHFPKHHDSVHFVMVNFSEVKNRPFTEIIKFIFLCLDSSLADRGMMQEYEKIDSLFKEGISYNDELILSQRLKSAIEYLAIEKKLTIILLFNQFDDYIGQVSSELFILLRSLRDLAKYRFSVIFSVSRPLEDTFEPELMEQFGDFLIGHVVYLGLSDQASNMFRLGYLEKLTGKTLEETNKKELLVVTGGHIRLVKVSAEALLGSGIKSLQGASLGEFLLDQKTVIAALWSIWSSLTPAEKVQLTSRPIADDDGYMHKVGLAKSGHSMIPLLERALEKNLFKQSGAKFVYDDTANTIKKGEAVVSDSLTKAEFRLLRYLLQHPDEVVERDAIVSTVWQENKAIAGISEQAIDQLIFRLRRKIEVDSNNPTHILTVKGRGIKYTP